MMTVVSKDSRSCRRLLCPSLSFASVGVIFASLVTSGGGGVWWSCSLSCVTQKKYLFNFDFDEHKQQTSSNCCCVFIGYVNLCRELLGHARSRRRHLHHSRHVSPPSLLLRHGLLPLLSAEPGPARFLRENIGAVRDKKNAIDR